MFQITSLRDKFAVWRHSRVPVPNKMGPLCFTPPGHFFMGHTLFEGRKYSLSFIIDLILYALFIVEFLVYYTFLFNPVMLRLCSYVSDKEISSQDAKYSVPFWFALPLNWFKHLNTYRAGNITYSHIFVYHFTHNYSIINVTRAMHMLRLTVI